MPLVEELAGDIRVQKLAVWVAFFGVIKLLKPFYSIIFATFVLAFVGSSFVDRTQRLYVSCARAIVTRLSGLRRRGESSDKSWAREILKRLEYSRGRTILPRALVPPRKAFAALYISSVLLAATTVFVRYGPVIARESQYFTAALTKEDPYLAAATAITATLGTHRVEQLDALLRSIADNEDFFSLATSHKPVSVRALSESLRHLISPQLVKLGALSSALLRPVPSLIYEVLTAMLFSFLIVWDLPLIGRAFSHLGRARTSWVRFAYAEISPRIRSFSRLLGTNFEITGLIAIVNTLLTTLGFLVLDISGTRFLGFLVFVCSFVPVVGVFVSTIPACILALVEHGGQRLAQVVGMVIFVHFVEAYLLYPQIYATKLKVHPLLVLVV
ncbi:hypothetical protein CTAYLR_007670 [Chrysophaeum taylorii]|uniref:AI-2E family transporter n=1 Tax=Chrysophaeum taylorii TaxID=2483200 RepID=A0AAD7U685_9STRA|nr:hypothetical protein CTAYLR_007670 [Chrysophaeum taylorii]